MHSLLLMCVCVCVCADFKATHRPIGLSTRLISQAKLITLHFRHALITAPPLVHRGPAGIGLLTHTTYYKPHSPPHPPSSDASPPLFSSIFPAGRTPSPAPRLPSLLYFSFLRVHVRRSDKDFPLQLHISCLCSTSMGFFITHLEIKVLTRTIKGSSVCPHRRTLYGS